MIKSKNVSVAEFVETLGYDVKVFGKTDVSEVEGAHTVTELCIREANCGSLFSCVYDEYKHCDTFVVTGAMERQVLADVFEAAAKVLRELDREHDAEHNKFMEDKNND